MKTIGRIFVSLIVAFLVSPFAIADVSGGQGSVFVGASVASVRIEPLENAPVAGKLPIGTRLTYIGSPSEVAAGPNQACGGADSHQDRKWACVCVSGLRVDYGVEWCGWVARDLLVANQPGLAEIVAEYDKTPAAEFPERRKWAERAVAFDPLNAQARERLIDVLGQMNETKALEAARRSFEAYATSQAKAAGGRQVFSFDGIFLEPIGELKDGQFAFREFDQSTNHEFRNRGRFYNLYSSGQKTGMLVTEAQFDCRVQQCPQQTIARFLPPARSSKSANGLATNFVLSNVDRSVRNAAKLEEASVQKMGIALVKSSSLSAKGKKSFLASIRQSSASPVLGIGALARDGRVMLIGNFTIGSMNDSHYGEDGDIYESILVIAEEQKDGSFRLASGSGSIAELGCSYTNHLDIDGDGTDEIFLYCEQLEGQYSYAFAKRVEGTWRLTYGEPRN